MGGGGGASSSQCRDGSTSGRKSGPRHPPLTQLPPRAHNARSTPPSHPRNARKLRRYATHDYQRYESRFDGATKRYFVGIEAVQLHERKQSRVEQHPPAAIHRQTSDPQRQSSDNLGGRSPPESQREGWPVPRTRPAGGIVLVVLLYLCKKTKILGRLHDV